MSLNNDTPISGLPEKQRNPIFDDLLITSQLISPGQYFTAKLTIATIYALFIANISIADVQQLQQTLNTMQQEINSKLDGSHTHVIAEVTGLQNALDNKAAVNHSHTIGQIAGLQAALDSKLDNATHTHTISQVTGLQAALNQKSALNHTHDMSEITNLVQALAGKLNVSLKGVANGLAELDASGRVPLTQSHLFIIERTNSSFFPTVGEGGKFYVDMQTGVSYRWNGAAYVPLSTGQDYLQLGETATTAYQGDLGKEAYDHSQSAHAPLDAQKNVQSDWDATSGDAMILNKPATMPPSEHSHTYADLTGTKPPTDAQKNVQSDWFATAGDAFIKNKPTEFPPTSHSHTYNDISGTKPPVNAQKNSDITKAEIEAKLTGTIGSHTHSASTIAGLQNWCDDLYLALTGGTLTGQLVINNGVDLISLVTQGSIRIGRQLVLERDGNIHSIGIPENFPGNLVFNSPGFTYIFGGESGRFLSLVVGQSDCGFSTIADRFNFNKKIKASTEIESDQVRISGDSNTTVISHDESGFGSVSRTKFTTDNERYFFDKDVYFGSVQKGTDGYTTLPNGVIMQWGKNINTSDINATVTFPITFPNYCLNVIAVAENTDSTRAEHVNVDLLTTSSFRWCGASSGSGGAAQVVTNGYWTAIGW